MKINIVSSEYLQEKFIIYSIDKFIYGSIHCSLVFNLLLERWRTFSPLLLHKSLQVSLSLATQLYFHRLDSHEESRILRKVNNNPELSAPRLTSQFFEESGKKVHVSTIRRVLYKSIYHERVARRRPFINGMNRKKRMAFAKEFVFADESKFEIPGCNRRKFVQRKVNTQFEKSIFKRL